MRALVTGAAGFIGSHITDALLEGDSVVVGIDSFTDYYDEWIKRANLAGPAARGATLYVNRGLGMAGLPLRINCPREIALLQLGAQ